MIRVRFVLLAFVVVSLAVATWFLVSKAPSPESAPLAAAARAHPGAEAGVPSISDRARREGVDPSVPPSSIDPAAAPAVALGSEPRLAARYSIRLLREDRTPIANTRLDLAFHEAVGNSSMRTGTKHATDGEGRFSFDRDVLPFGAVLQVEIEMPVGAVARRVLHSIEVSPVAGPNDLGDLVVPLLPLIAAGRVLDGRGTAVPGASIILFAPGLGTPGQISAYDATFDQTKTGADGTFELRGERSGDLAIGAMKKGVGDAGRTPIVAGVTGLEITLRSPGAIEGDVRVAPGFHHEFVRIELYDDAEIGTFGGPRSRDVVTLPPDGRFRFEDLAAGKYTVQFEATHPDPLLVVKGVVVTSGETTRDPRLTDLVLDTLVGVLEVRVEGGDGAPLDSDVLVRARTREHAVGARRIGVGSYFVLTQAAGQDLVVRAPGRVPQWIRDVKPSPTPLVVRLVAAPVVRVTLAGDFALDRGPLRLGIRLTPSIVALDAMPDPLAHTLEIEAMFDAARVAALSVPFPGAYDVSFYLREQVGSFPMDRAVDGSTPLAVTSEPQQERTIEAPETVRAALAK